MNISELQRALRQLRLGGMAAVLETRLHQAQTEPLAPIDLISCLISDELTLRSDRLLERRRKQAGFRDANRALDSFDFNFNPKMNRTWCSIWRPAASSANARTLFFLAQVVRARVIWLRPSASSPFCRVIVSSIAKHTFCWMNSPTPSPTVLGGHPNPANGGHLKRVFRTLGGSGT